MPRQQRVGRGKHHSGRTRKGDSWLRAALGEAAASRGRVTVDCGLAGSGRRRGLLPRPAAPAGQLRLAAHRAERHRPAAGRPVPAPGRFGGHDADQRLGRAGGGRRAVRRGRPFGGLDRDLVRGPASLVPQPVRHAHRGTDDGHPGDAEGRRASIPVYLTSVPEPSAYPRAFVDWWGGIPRGQRIADRYTVLPGSRSCPGPGRAVSGRRSRTPTRSKPPSCRRYRFARRCRRG